MRAEGTIVVDVVTINKIVGMGPPLNEKEVVPNSDTNALSQADALLKSVVHGVEDNNSECVYLQKESPKSTPRHRLFGAWSSYPCWSAFC